MRKHSQTMLQLIGMVKPLMGVMLLAIFLGVLGFLSATAISTITALGLVSLAKGEAIGNYVITALIVAGLVRGPLRYGEQMCNHYIAFKILAIMRSRVFTVLRTLAPAKLEGKDKGNLIALITSDIELLEVFYAHTISPMAIATIYSVVAVIFLYTLSPFMALYALMAYVIMGIVVPVYLSGRNRDLGLQGRNKNGILSGKVLDGLRGLREILQYRGEERYLRQLNGATDDAIRVGRKLSRETGFGGAFTTAVLSVLHLGLFVLGGFLYTKGLAAGSDVIVAIVFIMSSYGPTLALSALGNTLQVTFASGNRVLDLLEETPQVEEKTDGIDTSFDGADLHDVSFSYGDELILKDMSLAVEKGNILGLQGKSGSGKSTILRLLMRFWDVDSGEVSISKENIHNINTSNLRDMESFMTQESQLFNDTIANNLRIAKADADDGELEAACRDASIHDFIMSLPQGYDTPVGEMGSKLSSGERQRLGLARAFLHDAPFLLLDEPTSNLDSLNEAIILKSLQEKKKDVTVLMVSHRASSLKIADEVIEMESYRAS